MLILRSIAPAQGLISSSPFCMKSIGYLHLLGFDWQLDTKADIRAQPAGKLPVLVDGTQIIPDSNAIASYLEAKAGRSLNDGLSDSDKVLSHAMVRMFEEHLYFFAVYNRWTVDENFAGLRPSLEKLVPFPMSKILPGIIRKSVTKMVSAQGIGRMSDDMRTARLEADFAAIEAQLAGRSWLFGDTATAADLSLAPLLAVLQVCTADTPIRRVLDQHPRLTDYASHAFETAFPARDALPFPPR